MKQLKKFLPFMAAAVCVVTVTAVVLNLNRAAKMTSSGVAAFDEIIIDAGHGGEDGGAVGLYNIIEKDINLSISLKLADMLKAAGYKVTLVRATDISIHDEDSKTLRRKKQSDLHNRLKIMNRNAASLTVSIHQNIFSESKYSGAQVFYSPNHSLSQDFADIMQKTFTAMLQPDNSREVKAAGKNLFLMTNIKNPGILVECGFLSNPAEAKQLATDEYQNAVAFVVFAGVVEFMNSASRPAP